MSGLSLIDLDGPERLEMFRRAEANFREQLDLREIGEEALAPLLVICELSLHRGIEVARIGRPGDQYGAFMQATGQDKAALCRGIKSLSGWGIILIDPKYCYWINVDFESWTAPKRHWVRLGLDHYVQPDLPEDTLALKLFLRQAYLRRAAGTRSFLKILPGPDRGASADGTTQGRSDPRLCAGVETREGKTGQPAGRPSPLDQASVDQRPPAEGQNPPPVFSSAERQSQAEPEVAQPINVKPPEILKSFIDHLAEQIPIIHQTTGVDHGASPHYDPAAEGRLRVSPAAAALAVEKKSTVEKFSTPGPLRKSQPAGETPREPEPLRVENFSTPPANPNAGAGLTASKPVEKISTAPVKSVDFTPTQIPLPPPLCTPPLRTLNVETCTRLNASTLNALRASGLLRTRPIKVADEAWLFRLIADFVGKEDEEQSGAFWRVVVVRNLASSLIEEWVGEGNDRVRCGKPFKKSRAAWLNNALARALGIPSLGDLPRGMPPV